jgi:hypothetical protein
MAEYVAQYVAHVAQPEVAVPSAETDLSDNVFESIGLQVGFAELPATAHHTSNDEPFSSAKPSTDPTVGLGQELGWNVDTAGLNFAVSSMSRDRGCPGCASVTGPHRHAPHSRRSPPKLPVQPPRASGLDNAPWSWFRREAKEAGIFHEDHSACYQQFKEYVDPRVWKQILTIPGTMPSTYSPKQRKDRFHELAGHHFRSWLSTNENVLHAAFLYSSDARLSVKNCQPSQPRPKSKKPSLAGL